VKIIPTAAPLSDDDGGAYVYVVLVKYADCDLESPYATHRRHSDARLAARAQSGRVLRVPYYDGVPREPEQHPVGADPRSQEGGGA